MANDSKGGNDGKNGKPLSRRDFGGSELGAALGYAVYGASHKAGDEARPDNAPPPPRPPADQGGRSCRPAHPPRQRQRAPRATYSVRPGRALLEPRQSAA